MFGLGTIGLAVIDALQEAGARMIIGIDTDEGKFARAKEWGATHLINPKTHDKPIQVGAAPPANRHDAAQRALQSLLFSAAEWINLCST